MFVVFEGPDCSGKTTQIKLLEKHFKDKNIQHTLIREPGSTDLGEKCRTILLQGGLDKRSELALFFASRSDIVNKEILIKKNNEVVVSDRYIDSTVAYQCYGNQSISEKQLQPMLDFFSYGVKADLTFVLNVDYQTALSRMRDREVNHYDVAGEQYFNRLHEYYKSLDGKDKYFYIDTNSLDTQSIHDKILKHLQIEQLKKALPIPKEVIGEL